MFIDARKMGRMIDRTQRVFTDDDIGRVACAVKDWREHDEATSRYEDIAGFCYSAKTSEIEKYGFGLSPGRYVGAAEQIKDDEPFNEKMKRLVLSLKKCREESEQLNQEVAKSLRRIGYDF